MQTFDSNGPDVRIRGTAFQVHEKYLQLARDAASSGDRIIAENYLQHAEHYYRIIAAAQEQQQQQGGGDPNRRYRPEGGFGQDFRGQEGEGNLDGAEEFGGEEGESQAPRAENGGYRQEGQQRQDGNYRERGPSDRAPSDRAQGESGYRHNGENSGERRQADGDGFYRHDGRQDRHQNFRQQNDGYAQDSDGRQPSEERPRVRHLDDNGGQPQQPRRPIQYGDRPDSRGSHDNDRNGGSQSEAAVSAPVEMQLPLPPVVYGQPVDDTPTVPDVAATDTPAPAPRRGRPRRVKAQDPEPVAEG
jgi:hypothetical protein